MPGCLYLALPRLLCEGPARTNGLYPRKGTLSIGSDADIVIFDPEEEWTIHAENLHMATDFSPYEGMMLKGAVETTISRGEVVYADGFFQGEENWGRFIPS
jgi:dihydropyrimidinase